jgi:4-hydroxy-4-methyl-2-oxoglutarate aldolase
MNPLTTRFTPLPTAAVSDAFDALGLPGALHGNGPLTNTARAVGPAYTVRYEPITGEPGTVGDFLDDVPAGAVVVIDNAGRTDCTVWGGIMTTVASAKGVAGTVVHGVCRDVATAFSLGYPVFSAGRFMRTGKDRVRCVAVQQPVHIGGVAIAPGDLITADGDGVVAVGAAHLDAVVDLAEHIEDTERRIVDAVRAGRTLAEARGDLGYHSLQSRTA